MEGKQIQKLIQNFRIRQSDVASIIGLSGPVLSLILNGKIDLRPDVKRRLEAFLKVCDQVEKKILKIRREI